MMLPLLAALLVAPLQDDDLPTVADAVAAGQAQVLGVPARKHAVATTGCDLAPGGERALSTGYDDSVRLWNTATGEPAGTLEGHGEVVFFADFVGDERVVSAGGDGTLRLWDLAKGEVVKSHQLKGESPRFGAVSHDGKLVAFPTPGGRRVLVYDLGRMEEVDSVPALGAVTMDVEFSPDDRYIAACGQGSGFLVVYDRDQGRLVGQLSVDKNAFGLSFSPDGKVIAMSSGNRVMLWSVEEARIVDQLTGFEEPIHVVAFAPDGKVVFLGTRFGQLHGIELESGDTVFYRDAHHAFLTGLEVSADGTLLLSSAGDGSVRFWDVDQQIETRAPDEPNDIVRSLAWSRDGKQLFSASYDGRVDRWTIAQKTSQKVYSLGVVASGVCVPGDEPLAVMGEHLLGAAGPLFSFEDEEDAFTVVSPGGDGQVLVGLVSGGVELRDAQTGEVVRAYEGHDDALHAIALGPDGKRFASVSEDGTLRVFALETEEPICADDDASWDAVYGVAWLAADRIATVDSLGQLRVRDAETGADLKVVIVEPGEDEDEVTSASYDVVVLRDGRLVTISDAGLRVWNADDQELVAAIDTSDAIASCLALSPDGATIAAGMTNGTIVLWDVARLVK